MDLSPGFMCKCEIEGPGFIAIDSPLNPEDLYPCPVGFAFNFSA